MWHKKVCCQLNKNVSNQNPRYLAKVQSLPLLAKLIWEGLDWNYERNLLTCQLEALAIIFQAIYQHLPGTEFMSPITIQIPQLSPLDKNFLIKIISAYFLLIKPALLKHHNYNHRIIAWCLYWMNEEILQGIKTANPLQVGYSCGYDIGVVKFDISVLQQTQSNILWPATSHLISRCHRSACIK